MTDNNFFDILFSDPFDLNFDGTVTPEEEIESIHHLMMTGVTDGFTGQNHDADDGFGDGDDGDDF